MAHIVILGAGIGGMPAAYELRALLDSTRRQCAGTGRWQPAGLRLPRDHHRPQTLVRRSARRRSRRPHPVDLQGRPCGEDVDALPAVPAGPRPGRHRRDARQIKGAQIEATGADTVVLSCASCRLNFMAGAEVDRSTTRIESLIELVAAQLPPAAGPSSGTPHSSDV